MIAAHAAPIRPRVDKVDGQKYVTNTIDWLVKKVKYNPLSIYPYYLLKRNNREAGFARMRRFVSSAITVLLRTERDLFVKNWFMFQTSLLNLITE